MKLPKRLSLYFLGLLVMALGVVLIKKAELGMSPISAIPAAVARLAPRFTLGNTTIAFHVLCMLLQFAVLRRFTLKTALLLPLAVVFGYIIDLYMLIPFGAMDLWLRCLVCFGGIVCTALGIVIISGCDLMLPAPDSFLRALSARIGKPLGAVKTAGDVTWVAITAAIELLGAGRIASIGIGTLASMLLTGAFVSLFRKWMPFWEISPAASE